MTDMNACLLAICHNIIILKAPKRRTGLQDGNRQLHTCQRPFHSSPMSGKKMPGTFTKAKQPMKCADSCRNRSIVLQHARGYINRARPKRASHILLLLSVVVLAGCMPIVATEPSPAITGEQERYPPGIEPLPEGAAGVEGQESDADASGEGDSAEPATITIQRRNVNVRSGPGLDFEVVANAVDGDAFTTTGKSEEGWWRICCFAGPGDAPGEPTRSTWVSQVVIAPNQAALDLPILVPLFPEDMTASWNVQYECGSRRCAVSECAAVARTEINQTNCSRTFGLYFGGARAVNQNFRQGQAGPANLVSSARGQRLVEIAARDLAEGSRARCDDIQVILDGYAKV